MKRFRPSRDALVLGFLFLLLAAFIGFVAWRQQEADQAAQVYVPYSTHSARDNGALALYNWANALGYRAQRIEYGAFRVGDDARLMFIFAPRETIESSEARYLLDWVKRGNVLYIADTAGFTNNGLYRALDVESEMLRQSANSITLSQPFANASIQEMQGRTAYGLKTKRADVVEYSTASGQPLLLRIQHGQGTIWLSSVPALMSNENLKDDDNAAFARALLASAPAGSAIAFDEYHLGYKTETEESLLNVIYNSPWGWGILFAALVLFGYLILNGQRLGRTIPVQKTLARRTPSEYVVSMANLFRRANQRGMVLQHYRRALKRRLGRPFHLNPDLPDERYLELIARMRPELDRAELARILDGLRRTDTSEADLVKSVEHAVTFGARKKRG